MFKIKPYLRKNTYTLTVNADLYLFCVPNLSCNNAIGVQIDGLPNCSIVAMMFQYPLAPLSLMHLLIWRAVRRPTLCITLIHSIWSDVRLDGEFAIAVLYIPPLAPTLTWLNEDCIWVLKCKSWYLQKDLHTIVCSIFIRNRLLKNEWCSKWHFATHSVHTVPQHVTLTVLHTHLCTHYGTSEEDCWVLLVICVHVFGARIISKQTNI